MIPRKNPQTKPDLYPFFFMMLFVIAPHIMHQTIITRGGINVKNILSVYEEVRSVEYSGVFRNSIKIPPNFSIPIF